MIWQLQSLICTLVGVGFLGLAYLVESHTWGSPLTYLFGVPGVFLALTGASHFAVNTLIEEFTKGGKR